MTKILYADKDAYGAPPLNLGRAEDFNEIKGSVNALYDEVDTVETKVTTLVNPADAVAGDFFFWNGHVYGVVEGANGTLWLDRNLGAARVAQSLTDPHGYGDLYQWGRPTDGHQQRTSKTTATLSTTDTPLSNEFILPLGAPTDWRNPQKDTLWQGEDGINNPAPTGWRLPTETELDNERTSWVSNDGAGAFASVLKLPYAGSRISSDGSLDSVGIGGRYWSATVNGTATRYLNFVSDNASLTNGFRAIGFSLRCIKQA